MSAEKNGANSSSRKLLAAILAYFSRSPIADATTSLQLKLLSDLLERGVSAGSGSCALEDGENFHSLQYSNAIKAGGRTYTFFAGVDISRSKKYQQ